jgi:hypothetical protein
MTCDGCKLKPDSRINKALISEDDLSYETTLEFVEIARVDRFWLATIIPFEEVYL